MICNTCKNDKELTEFVFRKDRQTYKKRCMSCDNIYLQQYRNNNRDKYNTWSRANIAKRRDELNAKRRANYNDHERQMKRLWTVKNKEKVLDNKRQWRKNNAERINSDVRTRAKEDIQFKLKTNIRNRIRGAIKNGRSSGLMQYLGCSVEEFRTHIEGQFKEGMTWDNWTNFGWHLDHIIPLSKFDLTDPQQLAKALHYTNQQPLWWDENLRKGVKINEC